MQGFLRIWTRRRTDFQVDKASILAGAPGFAETESGIAALITRNDLTVDVATARELALLLERTGRLEALEILVNIFQSKNLKCEGLAYAASAAMLRKGQAQEARRI